MTQPTCVRHHLSHVGRGHASRAVREIWASVLHQCADATRRRHAPTGEVAVRPRHRYAMFDGYWNNAEATVDAWRGLWRRTGAFGRLDANGLLYFVDRKTDSLRRRGENVSSVELKTAIERQPTVTDVALHAMHVTGFVSERTARRAARASS